MCGSPLAQLPSRDSQSWQELGPVGAEKQELAAITGSGGNIHSLTAEKREMPAAIKGRVALGWFCLLGSPSSGCMWSRACMQGRLRGGVREPPKQPQEAGRGLEPGLLQAGAETEPGTFWAFFVGLGPVGKETREQTTLSWARRGADTCTVAQASSWGWIIWPLAEAICWIPINFTHRSLTRLYQKGCTFWNDCF